MKYYHIAIILLALSTNACRNDGGTVKFDCHELDSAVVCDAIVTDLDCNLPMWLPEQITMVNDSTLFFMGKDIDGNLFHLVTTDGDLKYSFGTIGQGAGEFLAPANICSISKNGKFYIFDFSQRKGHLYKLAQDSLIADGYIDYKKSLREGMYNYHAVINITDNMYMGFGITDKSRIMIVENDSERYNYSSYPILTDDLECNVSVWGNGAQFDISPDGKHLVIATQTGMAFEIFDINDGAIKSRCVKGFHEPIYEIGQGAIPVCVVTTFDSYIGFTSICTTNDGFYGCIGGEYPDYNEKKAIWFFDYDGNALKKINTNVAVECMTTDGSNIYAIVNDGDDNYRLKKILPC